MSKQTMIEKAIKSLDDEIVILELAKARLVAQQKAKPVVRRPRVVAKVEDRSA